MEFAGQEDGLWGWRAGEGSDEDGEEAGSEMDLEMGV